MPLTPTEITTAGTELGHRWLDRYTKETAYLKHVFANFESYYKTHPEFLKDLLPGRQLSPSEIQQIVQDFPKSWPQHIKHDFPEAIKNALIPFRELFVGEGPIRGLGKTTGLVMAAKQAFSPSFRLLGPAAVAGTLGWWWARSQQADEVMEKKTTPLE